MSPPREALGERETKTLVRNEKRLIINVGMIVNIFPSWENKLRNVNEIFSSKV